MIIIYDNDITMILQLINNLFFICLLFANAREHYDKERNNNNSKKKF